MSEKKMTPLAKAMGKQMSKSWEAPQYTHFSVVDCANLIEYRKSSSSKVSYTSILIKAIADTIREFPIMNASWNDGKTLLQNDDINIGVAVDTKRGLLVPVIKNADKLDIKGIDSVMNYIKSKSDRGNYNIDDLSGGTFILSNLGMFNVHAFTAIVNAPNSAIISVGKMEKVPVVKDSSIVIGTNMTMALNMDHRVIDGATGAKFLSVLVDRLENLN